MTRVAESTTPRRADCRGARASGATLVELMVGLAMGAVVVAAALELYAHSRELFRVSGRVARLQEHGRVAMTTIEPDVALAGYYGFTLLPETLRLVSGGNARAVLATADRMRQFPFDATGALPSAVAPLPPGAHACGVNFAVDVSMPVQGANDVFELGRARTSACNAYQNRPQGRADTLTLRRVQTQSVPSEPNRLQVYASRLTSWSTQLLFFDGVTPGPLDEHHRVHNLIVRSYYIARDSVGQSNYPALRVKTLTRSGSGLVFDDEEVMPGVEDLQVQFAIAGADGSAVRYVEPDDPVALSSVVAAVRVWLRLRADEPEPSFIDERTYEYANVVFTPAGPDRHYRRALISRTVAVRNVPALSEGMG